MMNFAKGIMIGSIVSAGVVLMYTDSIKKNKMIKKGKKILRNFGM